MDFVIKATNRYELRLYSRLFRSICGFTEDEPIDPVELLDSLPDLEGFGDVRYEVVYNNVLPGNVPARCIPDDSGYLIQIKESVYLGALEKKTGGYRMHIMHEIMHSFLDKLGYRPIYERQLTKETPVYCRLEWAVKAIAGEVMIPYNATMDMSEKDIISYYGVSPAAAKKRKTY